MFGRRIFIVAFLLSIPVSALGATQELHRAVYAATLPNSDTLDRGQRLLFAEAALDYWTNFDSRIPRNSPETQAWLMGELDTTDSERLTRAVNGPEYALWQLETVGTSCVNVFNLLSRNLSSPVPDVVYELYLWLKSVTCFYETEEILRHLRTAGLSNGRADGEFVLGFFSIFADVITGKLANSVIDEYP